MTKRKSLLGAAFFSLVWTAHCTSPESSVRKEQKPPPPSTSQAQQNAQCTINTPLIPGIPGSPTNLITSGINPNGDSELSHLMREMLSDLKRLRSEVVANRQLSPLQSNHARIRCTWPNDPDVRSPLFDSLSATYLAALESLQKKPAPNRHDFNAVVAGCLGCHNSFCPGPIHLIQNLWIDSAKPQAH